MKPRGNLENYFLRVEKNNHITNRFRAVLAEVCILRNLRGDFQISFMWSLLPFLNFLPRVRWVYYKTPAINKFDIFLSSKRDVFKLRFYINSKACAYVKYNLSSVLFAVDGAAVYISAGIKTIVYYFVF